MKSLSSVGLGLSIVFGCLLLALVGEVYYLLWRKRRRITNKGFGDNYFLYMFCLKKPSSLRYTPQELCSSVGVSDTFVHNNEHLQEASQDGPHEMNRTSKDFLLNKPFGDDQTESMEGEIMSLQGPPRFLFTIVEETKEDLESEDGRSRKSVSHNKRSLSDLLLSAETPYLTPIASPSFFTPPLTPMDRYNYQVQGAKYEVSKDAEFNRMRSSPPPKFKFLQDAEEKLARKKMMEEAEKRIAHCSSKSSKGGEEEEEEGTYITIVVDKDKQKEVMNQKGHHQLPHYYSSSTSQVMPLDSSLFQQPDHQKPKEVPNFSTRPS